jgi:hypothetical protein
MTTAANVVTDRDRPGRSVTFTVDGEPVTTTEKDLTPNQILALAGIDPATHHLVEVKGRYQHSYEGRGEEPVRGEGSIAHLRTSASIGTCGLSQSRSPVSSSMAAVWCAGFGVVERLEPVVWSGVADAHLLVEVAVGVFDPVGPSGVEEHTSWSWKRTSSTSPSRSRPRAPGRTAAFDAVLVVDESFGVFNGQMQDEFFGGASRYGHWPSRSPARSSAARCRATLRSAAR